MSLDFFFNLPETFCHVIRLTEREDPVRLAKLCTFENLTFIIISRTTCSHERLRYQEFNLWTKNAYPGTVADRAPYNAHVD
jgi:hypothetical protein